MNTPSHSPITDLAEPVVHDPIARMHWQRAKSVEKVAPHQYNVLGWSKDDVSNAGCWQVVDTIREHGCVEEWTPPEGVYSAGNRRPMTNRYPYLGDHAYWYSKPRNSVLCALCHTGYCTGFMGFGRPRSSWRYSP